MFEEMSKGVWSYSERRERITTTFFWVWRVNEVYELGLMAVGKKNN